MNPFAENWGIEASFTDEHAIVHRIYFTDTGDGWVGNFADMIAFPEAESIILKRTFERQGLNITMHKMTTNNPAPCARADFKASRGYEMDRRW